MRGKPPEESEEGNRLSLYIAGLSPKSQQAILNLKRICREYLSDGYDLEVIDIYQQPALASEGEIIATPTLIKHSPPPVTRMIGDLSDEGEVLRGLGLGVKP